ncbi:pheS [Wigglesworthia glossinidia endosymbiont of Glossina brevipalpis]|uniref:Phenylalanine--tRNA ligase alpha subunit n=1 Tax=Wigglesworthia glossinidia brevipalpis TaxID=36870 RepID=SYFA_WIGBR|nr:RecName: Full=Phenylalanine--tRNA ligase alpha subunit; AltName: Full=Phenylalanyl-tRNA synthetase alpha subunit; Short=PheRS [Wigglesworthia glossinidia endosymbiont of Glossina brevipalpis]BAC24231.1 pheS [Wigglesworthia glossinidia endosymbiont of Glossina brevipalpis]
MSYHLEKLNIKFIINQALIEIKNCKNIKELELIRIYWIGKNGFFSKKNKLLNILFPYEDFIKKDMLKKAYKKIKYIYFKKKQKIKNKEIKIKIFKEKIDISLPGRDVCNGSFHPISNIIRYSEKFFCSLGFSIVHGHEVENIYYNFDALNIPENHPSRTEHDTFWINENCLLRTQTSGIQIKVMESKKPPLKIISSGKVYRNDHDKTHTPMFHQLEGLMIDECIGISIVKSILYDFCYSLLGKKIKIRFRPSYFPFTEPSAEIDIMNEDGKWIEILGCGIVHPKILHNLKIDRNKYSGMAFGIGIERLAMLYYKLSDVRPLFINNLRFLKQFK